MVWTESSGSPCAESRTFPKERFRLEYALRVQANPSEGILRENYSNCSSRVCWEVVCSGFDCGRAVGGSHVRAEICSERPGRTTAWKDEAEFTSAARGRDFAPVGGRKVHAGADPSNGRLRDAVDDLFVDGSEARSRLRTRSGGGAAE